MARRTEDLQIIDEGRDKGKVYRITEMSAFDTEAWATRSINAIIRNAREDELIQVLPIFYSYLNELNKDKSSNDDLGESLKEQASDGQLKIEQATQALAINFASMLFNLPYNDLLEVTNPLLKCCQHYIDYQNKKTADIVGGLDMYCEEPTTIFTLRMAAFKMHTDFFTKAVVQSIPHLMATIQNQSNS